MYDGRPPGSPCMETAPSGVTSSPLTPTASCKRLSPCHASASVSVNMPVAAITLARPVAHAACVPDARDEGPRLGACHSSPPATKLASFGPRHMQNIDPRLPFRDQSPGRQSLCSSVYKEKDLLGRPLLSPSSYLYIHTTVLYNTIQRCRLCGASILLFKPACPSQRRPKRPLLLLS